MLCIDVKDLKKMFEDYQYSLLIEKILENKYSIQDVRNHMGKMQEITDVVVKDGLKSKENIEIFIALDLCLTFFSENDKICFNLKRNIKQNKLVINNIQGLLDVIEECTLTDFAIISKDGLRQFQLKQYREELKTEIFMNRLEKTLHKYGNGKVLDNINLIFVLQGEKKKDVEISFNYIDFHEINLRVSRLSLSFNGEILIMYNEGNKYSVINRVYPKLSTSRKEFTLDNSKRKL